MAPNSSLEDFRELSDKAEEIYNSLVQNEMQLQINNLVNYFHNESSVKGWWTAKDGSDLRENPFTFSNKLCLIHSEISEAMEGDRTNAMDDKLPHRKMVEVELADALIRILDLAGAYGLDLGGAVVEKAQYNKTRKDHSKEVREADNGKKY